jgi:hypothetical protein
MAFGRQALPLKVVDAVAFSNSNISSRAPASGSVQGSRVPRLQPFVVLEHVIERAVDDGVEPGHSSSIAIRGDIYGHTSDATTRAAIDGLTNALGLS